jgi:hypothetical protein
MSIGVFLSPSSQPWNSCKSGDTEEEHMRALAFKIKELFDKDDRFECKVCDEFFKMSENDRLYNAVLQSDAFYDSKGGNTWHIALHSDGFNSQASGFSCFFIGSGSGKILADKIKNNLGKISPWGCRSIREYPELYELRKTKASSVLIENNFHDEPNQAKWIHDNINNGKLANVYYVSVCEAEGLTPKNFNIPANNNVPTPPPVTNTTPLSTNKDEVWKKELVQKCIDLALLEDTKWLEKYDNKIEVFAVCKMMIKLNDKFVAMEKQKIDVSGIVKAVLSEMESKYITQTVNIVTKK